MEKRTENRQWESPGKEVHPCTIEFIAYNFSERLLRAAKIGGICWLLAVLTVPVPPVHWVSVPGFLLLGVFLGAKKLALVDTADNATGNCPSCEHPITIKLGGKADSLPRWEFCPDCEARVRIFK